MLEKPLYPWSVRWSQRGTRSFLEGISLGDANRCYSSTEYSVFSSQWRNDLVYSGIRYLLEKYSFIRQLDRVVRNVDVYGSSPRRLALYNSTRTRASVRCGSQPPRGCILEERIARFPVALVWPSILNAGIFFTGSPAVHRATRAFARGYTRAHVFSHGRT